MTTPIRYVILDRAEGPATLCGKPVAVHTVKQADAILRTWAATAPAPGAYDKVDFVLVFQDGQTYAGRYDLTRADRFNANLAAHVRRFLEGLHRCANPAAPAYAEFLATHDITR